MIISDSYTPSKSVAGSDARAIFGQTMGLVAITCLFAAGGAYIGLDMKGWSWIVPWLFAIGALVGLSFANAKGKYGLATTLLFAVGLLLGISVGSTINYYLETDPTAVYQAAGATALFVGVLGAGGYATKRDLSFLYRIAFFLLIGLLVFGIALIFINLPAGSLIYSILGLGVFGLYTVLDFNRLKRAGTDEVIPLAAGIFLDVFNIFLFFLRIFGNR